MSKLVKVGTCLTGGGLIIGGGIATSEALRKESVEESSAPVSADTVSSETTPLVIEGEVVRNEPEEETVSKALEKMGLEIAKELSEFKIIYDDLMKGGTISWAQTIMRSEYKIVNHKNDNVPGKMKSKCEEQVKRKFYEFNGKLKTDEFKTIKLVCTKNYSLTHNAKDYLADEDLTIHSESQELDSSKWQGKLDAFRKKGLGTTLENLRFRCMEFGKELYRQNSPNRANFYNFCVNG